MSRVTWTLVVGMVSKLIFPIHAKYCTIHYYKHTIEKTISGTNCHYLLCIFGIYRGQKARTTTETPVYDPKSGNPFSERPSTARQNEMAKNALECAMVDLDKDSNIPDGVDIGIWERMCKYRRLKIESEQLVRKDRYFQINKKYPNQIISKCE